MKFAVIEYTSKSGGVWAHSKDIPNYLADPDKDIDPTSFGCYVSALEGEHIPLKGFITGTVVPVSSLLKNSRRLFRAVFHHWPTGYDVSFFEQFEMVLVVHQISDGFEITTFVEKLKKLNKRPYIIGVFTQPFGILEDHYKNHPHFLKDMRSFMNACDVFITLAKSTQNVWQEHTSTPVVYVPQPYPVEYALRFWRDAQEKKPIIFVAGVTDRKNIALGQRMAKKLQEKFPQYTIHITDTPGYTQNTEELTGASVTTIPFLPWQKQLEYLASVKLVINTDFTQTRGRVQVDCAAVGTATIGADSDAQRDLYPEFEADEHTSEEELMRQSISLLTDEALYTRTVTTAKEKLLTYTYEQSKKRLLELPHLYPKQES